MSSVTFDFGGLNVPLTGNDSVTIGAMSADVEAWVNGVAQNIAEPAGDVTSINVTAGDGNVIDLQQVTSANGFSFPWITINGGVGDDSITGSEFDDQIFAGGGNDFVNGKWGFDNIWGDAGNDTLYGGGGQDIVDGGDGNDLIQGQGFSNDVLNGGDGDDTIFADAGDDFVYGNAGNDSVDGGDGNDQIFGDDGNDFLSGGNDTDSLYGGAGDDVLFSGSGVVSTNPDPSLEFLDGEGDCDWIDGLEECVNVAPTITSAASVSVDENWDDVFLTVTADDPEFDPVTFEVGPGGVDSGYFTIDATTGELVFNSLPDFENPLDAGADNTYDIEVTADDGNGGTDTQAVSVTVNPVNDNNPVFTSSSSASIAEGDLIVQGLSAIDADLPAQTITFMINEGIMDWSAFMIDPNDNLVLTAPLDFESPMDSNSDNVYEVEVIADDGEFFSSIQAIAVTVTNANDWPTITSDSTPSVPENTTAVVTVASTDPDGNAPTYSIAGGDDEFKFSINSTTGALSFTSAPNFEIPSDANGDNEFEVNVKVVDGLGGEDTQAITVSVTDANESPTITSVSSISIPENTTSVLTVTATDVDGDTPMYSISGGADQAKFSIDNDTGALTFLTAPSFETPADSNTDNTYKVEVTAIDGNVNPFGLAFQMISVSVQDVNEAPTVENAIFRIPRNFWGGMRAGQLQFNDPDIGQTMTFTTSNSLFTVASDGNLTVSDMLNVGVQYIFTATITDSGTPALSDTATIVLEVVAFNVYLDEVWFDGSHTIYKDPTGATDSTYSVPEYEKPIGMPYDPTPSPVAYKRGSTLKTTSKIRTDGPVDITSKVRALGPDNIDTFVTISILTLGSPFTTLTSTNVSSAIRTP